MDILAYLMAKKGHNTAAIDLPSYLLGRGTSPSERIEGTGTDISLSPTAVGKLDITFKGNTEQDGTPTPDNPIMPKVVTGENEVKIENKNLFDKNSATLNYRLSSDGAPYKDNSFVLSDYITHFF